MDPTILILVILVLAAGACGYCEYRFGYSGGGPVWVVLALTVGLLFLRAARVL